MNVNQNQNDNQGFKLIYSTGSVTSDYEPPLLFRDYGKYRDYDDLRLYIENELIRMAEEGTLCVTDCLNQPSKIRNTIGEILKGIRWNEERRQEGGMEIHPALTSYQVKIRSINGKNITWKRGKEPLRRKYSQHGGSTTISGESNYRNNLKLYTDVYIDTGQKEISISLPQAWTALSQAGKYCRPARREGLQRKYWHFEEVMPGKKSDDETESSGSKKKK